MRSLMYNSRLFTSKSLIAHVAKFGITKNRNENDEQITANIPEEYEGLTYHPKFRSPVCVRLCIARVLDPAKPLPHSVPNKKN